MIKNSTWQSPSNIAIIKYWGKHGLQLPQNPSFSFTLSKARTETSLSWNQKPASKGRSIELFLDGRKEPSFLPKIENFFARIEADYPILKDIKLVIETHNTFPHSSGIASSASAFSALSCCIGEILNIKDKREISRLARLGSGSACRSLFASGAIWGKTEFEESSSDHYAVSIESKMHEVFKSFRDSILIIKSGEKAVSSTAGHKLMENHPFSEQRYQNARVRMGALCQALKSGDIDTFGEICEKEALELHALMMCSSPPYVLMEPGTLEVINLIQKFRKETGVPIYFTLDAGPNVHLLYPSEYVSKVTNFIESSLVPFCEDGFWIDDFVGSGPSNIK